MAEWELPVTLIMGGSLGIICYIANNWTLTIFPSGKTENMTSNVNAFMKIALTLFVLWLIPVLLQLGDEIATSASAPADVSTLIITFFQVSIFSNIIISVYVFISFFYSTLILLGVNVNGIKLSGRKTR